MRNAQLQKTFARPSVFSLRATKKLKLSSAKRCNQYTVYCASVVANGARICLCELRRYGGMLVNGVGAASGLNEDMDLLLLDYWGWHDAIEWNLVGF